MAKAKWNNGTTALEGASPADVVKFCRKKGVQMVDFKFTDLPGMMQHFSIPAEELTESVFEEGAGFDGSSIRGFMEIHESDMLLMPDPGTAVIDPMLEVPTLSLICTVRDPILGTPFTRDPRHVAQKAEAYLTKTGIATMSYWGPEIEFYIFDDVRYEYTPNSSFHRIDSQEGSWNTGRDEGPNLGYKPRYKEGYFPVPPSDSFQDFRSRAVLKMKEVGIDIEVHHHEVGTAGQAEIDMRFKPMTRMGDQMQMYKYILRNYARQCGKTITFMPKPLFMDNGSGMHVHQSLWKNETPLFFDKKGYALLSQTALYYIGGLLKHSPALLAFCAPTTNSYRRLVPGYEAPINLVHSQRNRSAACRIPMYTTNPKAKRIEYRCPDPSANAYLCLAAMLMAGLDGIKNRIQPGAPVDRDIYHLDPAAAAKVKQVPGSLEEVLNALERDHDFLLEGSVFTKDLIETWIAYKREKEVDPIRLRPHPYEFHLYYDI
ncbi:MAG: glutamine synthetase type [Acidobacteria bacterium]|nr:glutamine synthetase type [Acidobacteriota bacterium]